MSYDAILLTSFGGPEGPDEVMPYLERVTAGRGVPHERLVEVSHHYLALGGVSPINSQNRALLAALKDRLPERGVEIPIYLGNRNSEPYFADVLTQMHNDGHSKVLAWVTSAYSSYSGCRQYRENLAQALTVSELEGKMTIDKVRHYFDHPGFLAPIIEDLNKAMGRLAAKGIATADTIVMFATHSIPESMGESSGPPGVREGFEKPGGTYAAQHLAAATLAMAGLSEQENLPSWELVYQSRSGSPSVPWLEPDVNDAIRTAKDAGKKAIVIVPIGFVSDHVEVIWDLDNEAKETCDELGLEFERVATSGTHSAFVEGIIDLIKERTDGLEAKALSPLGPWPSFCKPDCCPNLRKPLPVIAEG
ncbi:ferrochelatase [Candidatus Aquiluna sp. UB-MaderosW2red]|uniref:ferrochelatase n=1 Tax=Candidatus Aquiluna sp. UB-MaderosW2red TaxID=1855377 RepID=UPI000875D8CF|nr:ferrochelatase [Candidatus Aquiluna sp. UB-MaderosW2red]SCX15050.1 ferrochelatase [Candidatus Aquiluna sp. UB-MaderosW2red]